MNSGAFQFESNTIIRLIQRLDGSYSFIFVSLTFFPLWYGIMISWLICYDIMSDMLWYHGWYVMLSCLICYAIMPDMLWYHVWYVMISCLICYAIMSDMLCYHVWYVMLSWLICYAIVSDMLCYHVWYVMLSCLQMVFRIVLHVADCIRLCNVYLHLGYCSV